MAIELFKSEKKVDDTSIFEHNIPNIYDFDENAALKVQPKEKSRLDKIFDNYEAKQKQEIEPDQLFDVEANNLQSTPVHQFAREEDKTEKLYNVRAKLLAFNLIFFAIGLLSVCVYNLVVINNLNFSIKLKNYTNSESNAAISTVENSAENVVIYNIM